MRPSDLSSQDMERGVLCALINAGDAKDGSLRDRCKAELPLEVFIDQKHKVIYQLIINNGRVLDLLSLWREIENNGYTDIVDKQYLIAISEVATGTAHAGYYIQELNKCLQNRIFGEQQGNPSVFPHHVMKGVAGEFAHVYGSYLETPKEFLFMNYLVCMGSVLADRLTLASEIRPQPRLYLLNLGESAEERKSTAISKVVDHFKDTLDQFNVCWGVGSAEGLQKRLEETRCLLLCFDEFRQFVSKCKIEASVLLPCVNTLFESNRYESRTKKTDINLEGVYLSMLAASTVQTYERTWDSSFTDIGFNNRLFIVPASGERKFSIPVKVPDREKRCLRGDLGRLLKHVGEYLELHISQEAKDFYHHWYMNLERSIHTKRLDTYAMRFMSMLAVNELKDEVDIETVRAAIALCDWQLEMRKQHDPIDAENAIAKMEEKIRRVLSRQPKTERELKQLTHANRFGLWFFDMARKNLQRGGEIQWHKKTRRWELIE